MGYCDVEWLSLETNQDHFAVFETAPVCRISDSFVGYEGYSISSKGSLPTVKEKKERKTHLNSLECHDVYESCLETNSPVQSGDLKFDHFEVSIFNLKSPTALQVIDLRCLVILWRRNSRGQGGQRPYQQ